MLCFVAFGHKHGRQKSLFELKNCTVSGLKRQFDKWHLFSASTLICVKWVPFVKLAFSLGKAMGVLDNPPCKVRGQISPPNLGGEMGCQGGLSDPASKTPLALVPDGGLHWCKRGFGWCKRLSGDFCSLKSRRPFAPSPNDFPRVSVFWAISHVRRCQRLMIKNCCSKE